MTGICPSCGFNLVADHPFTVGDLYVDPRGMTRWKGAVVALTPAQAVIVATLAREAGRPVTQAVLRERIDSDNDSNVVEVLISRIRDTFDIIEPGFNRIETLRSVGYRWRID